MDSDQFAALEWPSKRIPPGGILHPRKVVYSPETYKTLKVIMDEAKLTMLMRKQLDWCLRSGASLNDITQGNEHQNNIETMNVAPIRPRTSRRRSYLDIKQSGDLERERYYPTRRAEDREVIKKKLQNIMEFGRETESTNIVQKDSQLLKKSKTKLPSKMDIVFDLLAQIQDREEWLQEMEALGEGAKHREVINSQIAERIRKIDKMNVNIEEEMRRIEMRSNKSSESQITANNSNEINLARNENKIDNSNEANDNGLSISSFRTDNRENENNEQSNASTDSIRQLTVKPMNLNSKRTIREKREVISDKSFGGLFENSSKSNLNHVGNIRKENMRGYFIEGSTCSLSGKSDNVPKKQQPKRK